MSPSDVWRLTCSASVFRLHVARLPGDTALRAGSVSIGIPTALLFKELDPSGLVGTGFWNLRVER